MPLSAFEKMVFASTEPSVALGRLELRMSTPLAPLKAMMLPAPGSGPPIKVSPLGLPVKLKLTKIPSTPLPRGLVPLMSVPMKLP